MIISRCAGFYNNICSGSLLVCRVQVCVNTRQRSEDISNGSREIIVAAQIQKQKGWIYQQMCPSVKLLKKKMKIITHLTEYVLCLSQWPQLEVDWKVHHKTSICPMAQTHGPMVETGSFNRDPKQISKSTSEWLKNKIIKGFDMTWNRKVQPWAQPGCVSVSLSKNLNDAAKVDQQAIKSSDYLVLPSSFFLFFEELYWLFNGMTKGVSETPTVRSCSWKTTAELWTSLIIKIQEYEQDFLWKDNILMVIHTTAQGRNNDVGHNLADSRN